MRGEQFLSLVVCDRLEGSSPRARGTGVRNAYIRHGKGIIPACAGNRWHPGQSMPPARDHPRVRGEQIMCVLSPIMSMGSSPRARGTVLAVRELDHGGGIIPACAGNSVRLVVEVDCDWDHPRVRGEQLMCNSTKERHWGSSPRARGTAGRAARDAHVVGIIPACAGNSWPAHAGCRCGRDHPRVRGEQRSSVHVGNLILGSSPRARGTDTAEGLLELQLGIIPACAGNSRHPERDARYLRDHPRVRGEQHGT